MREICYNTSCSAGVAHLVERHLAKVEVASSSLVTRSKKPHLSLTNVVFYFSEKEMRCLAFLRQRIFFFYRTLERNSLRRGCSGFVKITLG